MQTKDVETHQVFFLLSEQALLQISRLLNLLFWPKVCDTNDTNNCFAPLQIPTKFKTVLTALGPGPHDEDTAINLTLMVILHTENWPVGIYMLILILFSCTRIASTPSSRMSGTTTLSPASSTWTWPGQTLCFSGEMKNCCATWLQISRHANNTISCTLAIGEPRIQVAGTLLTQVKWLFLCVLVLLITLCHWQYILKSPISRVSAGGSCVWLTWRSHFRLWQWPGQVWKFSPLDQQSSPLRSPEVDSHTFPGHHWDWPGEGPRAGQRRRRRFQDLPCLWHLG